MYTPTSYIHSFRFFLDVVTLKMTVSKWMVFHDVSFRGPIQSLPRFIIWVQCNVQSGNPIATALKPTGHGPLTAEVIHVVECLVPFWNLKGLSTKNIGHEGVRYFFLAGILFKCMFVDKLE